MLSLGVLPKIERFMDQKIKILETILSCGPWKIEGIIQELKRTGLYINDYYAHKYIDLLIFERKIKKIGNYLYPFDLKISEEELLYASE